MDKFARAWTHELVWEFRKRGISLVGSEQWIEDWFRSMLCPREDEQQLSLFAAEETPKLAQELSLMRVTLGIAADRLEVAGGACMQWSQFLRELNADRI